jgi:hypothetical protein
MSEWPKFTATDWTTNKRHAFLKFKLLLSTLFSAIDFVIGNDHYGGDWALIYDAAARKTHPSYPPPDVRSTQAHSQAHSAFLAPASCGYLHRSLLFNCWRIHHQQV